MRDYTCEGVPVSKLATDHIRAMLDDFALIEIRDCGCYRTMQEAEIALRKRLELELDIRRWGLR